MNCALEYSDSNEVMRDAIASEEAMVKFYEGLAEHCKIPRLKDTFYALARAEELHARKLSAVLNEVCYGRLD
jgi:rubrerythrin